MEAANAFLEQNYLPKMNDRFSVPPAGKEGLMFPSGMLIRLIFSVLRRSGW
jgi:hypothetical protein